MQNMQSISRDTVAAGFLYTKKVKINGKESTILLNSGKPASALTALANVILLSSAHSKIKQPLSLLVEGLSPVSLNDIISALTSIGTQTKFNDDNIGSAELARLLQDLHAGDLRIDPAFNGSFQDGPIMRIFRIFDIGIVHGWLVDKDVDPSMIQVISQYSYEQAQKVIVQSYDLQHGPDPIEKQNDIQRDSQYLKSFLARSATQLTKNGIDHLLEVLVERSFSVLYRNNEYSVIYKNNGKLYTLVAEEKWARHPEVTWKSLSSMNGQNDMYYSGYFVTLANITEEADFNYDNSAVTQISPPLLSHNNPFADKPQQGLDMPNMLPDDLQQLEDDEMLARRLQEEEDQRGASNLQDIYETTGKSNVPSQRQNNKKKSMFSLFKNKKQNQREGKFKCVIM